MRSEIQEKPQSNILLVTTDCEYHGSKSFQEVLISTAQNMTEIPDSYTSKLHVHPNRRKQLFYSVLACNSNNSTLFPVVTFIFLNMSEPYE
jgi:hypothetical protein